MFKRNALLALSICLALISARAQADTRPIRVACIGDSITNAASTGDREKTAYPVQLQGLLGADYEVKNFGVSGATMLKKSEKPYWKEKRFEAAKDFTPDIVVIKLGTNDSKPQHWDAEGYGRDYRDMVKEIQALPSHPKIILCRPVPAFSDKFAIRNPIILSDIIPTLDKISAESHLPVVDAYNALLGSGNMFPDGIHPNAEGCKILASTVAEVVRLVAVSVPRE